MRTMIKEAVTKALLVIMGLFPGYRACFKKLKETSEWIPISAPFTQSVWNVNMFLMRERSKIRQTSTKDIFGGTVIVLIHQRYERLFRVVPKQSRYTIQ